MPSTQASSDSTENEINLKHRLTGAAVLIFFGALFLPWLLGPPSEAKKVNAEVEEVHKRLHSTFEDEVLAQLQDDEDQSSFVEPEETVYISKITPVNGRNVASDPEPVGGDGVAVIDDEVEDKADAIKIEVESTVKTTQTSVSKAAKVVPERAAAANQLKDRAAKSDSLEQKADDAKAQAAASQAELISAAKPIAKPTPKPKEIDVGWIVQVELLTDKQGAQKLVENLRDKKFDPKTTVVDTNKGKATGTRIWIGPFESRKQANAENDKLESEMGKRGFIRVYP